ncbi:MULTISPECIES: hypothetical protein [Halorientalis]|jgi:hypothetical protein|uniref:Uncharacterized protein n=1 Tax=Halorientalis regularis TaxID=660518 RepID=A0A1G7T0H4_9EURY|nr:MULTISPECIES: hypothetical protein [Halorientalis]SDG28080.1 hypothetical protein SAMN05216218_12121 [Halorientalis regularis]
MRTLRVKLTVPAADAPESARQTFATLSELHADQAIFQVNRTAYVDEETWGFQVQYESELQTSREYVQTTSLAELEQVMARLAPASFEERVTDDR